MMPRFAISPIARPGSVSPRARVVAVATSASLAVVAVAGVGVMSAHRDAVLEVDGVSRPVSVWGTTVGDVLKAAGVEPGDHDLVSPGPGVSIAEGDTVVVRTAHPYQIAVAGQERTVWTTSSSADTILADASSQGGDVTMAADRSHTRETLTPLVSRPRPVGVLVGGAPARQVTVRPGDDVRTVLTAAGVELSPLDQVSLSTENGSLQVKVTTVTRGLVTTEEPIAFTQREEQTDALFVGESQVVTAGHDGVAATTAWTETADGATVFSSVTSTTETAQPVEQVTQIGTKEATPEALVKAGIDPLAKPEKRTDADGIVSVRYRAKLGSISTPAQIAAITGTPTAASAGTSGSSTSGVTTAGQTYSGASPQAIAQQMVADRGWADSEFQCLVSLWNRESHWNPFAYNAGSGAYGIPQALPGSKMASAGADWQTNPGTQITWGLGYIAGRYGTPCAAWGHSQSTGWY